MPDTLELRAGPHRATVRVGEIPSYMSRSVGPWRWSDPHWLWQKFESFIHPEPNSGCWLWSGGETGDGYGRFYNGTTQVLAHRFAFEAHRGAIPPDKQIDHLCRIRCCVNPDHMEIVTGAENTLRGFSPSALCARKTHCVNGHEFTPENTLRGQGRRQRRCRTCDNNRRRKMEDAP